MRRHPYAAAAVLLASAFLAGTAVPGRSGESKPAFIGARKGQCAKCHNSEVKAWKESKHAAALDSLRPVTEAANKARFDRLKKAGLDPSKDYSSDPKCLRCHVTGYGKDGGYPEKVTEENKDSADVMGSVSCEVCHGPASGYADLKNSERKKDPKRKFAKEELEKAGLLAPTAETCKACHNDEVPVKAGKPLDFEKAKAGVHPVKK